MIKKDLYKYSEDEQGSILINHSVYKLMNKIRYKIYNISKTKWNYYELKIDTLIKSIQNKRQSYNARDGMDLDV